GGRECEIRKKKRGNEHGDSEHRGKPDDEDRRNVHTEIGNFLPAGCVGMGVSMIDDGDHSHTSTLLPVSTSVGVGTVREAVPTTGVGEILALADELTRIGSAGTQLARRIEAITGLRGGQVQVLAAVDAGSELLPGTAAVIGRVVEATEATTSGLVGRELRSRHAHSADPSGEPALVHLTPAGRAVLEQVEAVQIRIADALAGS